MKFKKYTQKQLNEISKFVHDALHESDHPMTEVELAREVFRRNKNTDPLWTYHLGMAVNFIFNSHLYAEPEIHFIDPPLDLSNLSRGKKKILN